MTFFARKNGVWTFVHKVRTPIRQVRTPIVFSATRRPPGLRLRPTGHRQNGRGPPAAGPKKKRVSKNEKGCDPTRDFKKSSSDSVSISREFFSEKRLGWQPFSISDPRFFENSICLSCEVFSNMRKGLQPLVDVTPFFFTRCFFHRPPAERSRPNFVQRLRCEVFSKRRKGLSPFSILGPCFHYYLSTGITFEAQFFGMPGSTPPHGEAQNARNESPEASFCDGLGSRSKLDSSVRPVGLRRPAGLNRNPVAGGPQP